MRIAASLRDRIENGTYPPGSRMPSESQLGKEFSVVRGTVRRALMTLQDEKLVQVARGIGWFVCRQTEESPSAPAVARYHRVVADLRSAIEGGELRPGDWLPGEKRLTKRYGVSRYTAQRALAELEGAGLVERVVGRGRRVKHKTSPDDPPTSVDVR